MKLHAPKHLVLTLMVAAALALATAALADKTWKQIPNPDEIVFDEQFTFDGGPELSVEVDDLDIVLVEGSGGSARVQVEIKSRNRDKAQEYFDELRFRARMEGGELIVETRRPKVTIAWGWNKWNGIHARAVITVPKGTDMRLLTSDGDLSGEDIEGNVDARTGDGDITFASVKGDDVSIKASDGDVRIGGIVSNNIHIASADGDLTLGELKAPTIALKTSDGDVRVDGIEGDDMTVRSADGDVTIEGALALASGVNLYIDAGGAVVIDDGSVTPPGDIVITPGPSPFCDSMLPVFPPERLELGFFTLELSAAQLVEIDVRPQRVVPRSRGHLWVVIEGSDDLDVREIDSDSLRLGPEAAPLSQRGRALRYVDANRDGLEDLIARFETRRTGVQHGDEALCLRGATFAGFAIEGCDEIDTRRPWRSWKNWYWSRPVERSPQSSETAPSVKEHRRNPFDPHNPLKAGRSSAHR